MRAVVPILLIVVSLLSASCRVGYVTKQGMKHLHVLAARKPVDRAIERGKVPPEWISKIETIADAREFGVERLGLPAKDLYRSISLVKPGPTWVVTACAKDALRPVTWWFPVTGRVAYRGYYDREDAERLAARLREKDLDVRVGPVDAFSTLGWFADPIRPAMLDRSDTSLVNLVLHEAAHRVLYYRGQTDFNEAFASFVGDAGTLLFLADRHGADCEPCRRTEAAYADALTFSAFIEELVGELDELYARSIERDEKIREREGVFRRAQESFTAREWQGRTYGWFPDQELDNAVVLSLSRYEAEKELFERTLAACGDDLRRAILFIERLGWQKMSRKEKRSIDPFALLRQRLDQDAPCPVTDSP